MPNKLYTGQKLIKLVAIRAADNTSRPIPHTPEMIFTRYRSTRRIDRNIRIPLSIWPRFVFIVQGLDGFGSDTVDNSFEFFPDLTGDIAQLPVLYGHHGQNGIYDGDFCLTVLPLLNDHVAG